jgi:DNA-binding transcriptional MerR regulator
MSGVTTRPEPVCEPDDSPEPDDHRSGQGDVRASEDAPRLTVAAVAHRLGVAPATLRTWDRRYGLGPSDHATGHHRRYGPDDIARLEHMQRALLRGASPAEAARYALSVSVAPHSRPAEPDHAPRKQSAPEEPILFSGVLESPGEAPAVLDTSANTGGGGLKLPGAGPRTRGLGRAALALDSRSAQHLLLEAITAEGVVVTWREVLQPVLRAIIDRRQRTGSGIEVQQLLVDGASTALRTIIGNAPPPLNPRPVLLAPASGEVQELELVALAAALAENRIGHRLFGSALPKEGLDAAIRRAAPVAVVVWSKQPHYASPALVGDLPQGRQRIRAFAGGPGWAQETLPEHVEVLDSLETAVDRVSAILLD